MKRTGKIYCFTSPSGKSYVGQTWKEMIVSETGTFSRYRSDGYGSGGLLQKAIKKYGFENLKLTVLQEGIQTQEDLDEAEIFWISYLMTFSPNGYNLKLGGCGGLLSERTKRKIGDISRGKKRSKETCEKIRKTLTGRIKGPLSEEHKRKLSIASNKHKHSAKTKERISQSLKGHTVTEETRKKISDSKRVSRADATKEQERDAPAPKSC